MSGPTRMALIRALGKVYEAEAILREHGVAYKFSVGPRVLKLADETGALATTLEVAIVDLIRNGTG